MMDGKEMSASKEFFFAPKDAWASFVLDSEEDESAVESGSPELSRISRGGGGAHLRQRRGSGTFGGRKSSLSHERVAEPVPTRKRSSRSHAAALLRNARMATKMAELSAARHAIVDTTDVLHFRVLVALALVIVVLLGGLAVAQYFFLRSFNDPFALQALADVVMRPNLHSVTNLLRGRLPDHPRRVFFSAQIKSTLEQARTLLLGVGAEGALDAQGKQLLVHAYELFSEEMASRAENVRWGVFSCVLLAVVLLGLAYFFVFRLNLKSLERQQVASLTLMEQRIIQTLEEIEIVESISEVAAELMETESLEKLTSIVLSRCADLVHAEGGMLFLFDRQRSVFRSSQYVTSRKHLMRNAEGRAEAVEIPVASNESFLRDTLLHFNPRRLTEPSLDQGFLNDFESAFSERSVSYLFRKARSALAVPLYHEAEPLGVMLFINKVTRSGDAQQQNAGALGESDEAGFTLKDEQLIGGVFGSLVEHALSKLMTHSRVRRMKRQMEQILSSITAIVANFGADKRLLATNKADELRDLFELDHVVDVSALTYDEIFPSAELKHALDSVFGTQRPVAERSSLRLRSGVVRHISYSAAPLASATGGIAMVIEDVSREMRIKEALTRYMSPSIAEKAIADGNVLGGSIVMATVVFADMRNFTSLSEQLDPQKLLATLNEHFSGMIDCSIAHNGVIDKFIGDCLMSVHGIPFSSPDDAFNAVESILDTLAFLDKISQERAARGLPVLSVGVGANSGMMLAGNLGNESRADFTVVGDSVNLASRLEGATKVYGVKNLVSGETLSQAGVGRYVARHVDTMQVVGRTEPVCIFELHGRVSDPAMGDRLGMLATYEEARCAYTKGDWGHAATLFAALAQTGDKCSAAMLERVSGGVAPAGWNGVWKLSSK